VGRRCPRGQRRASEAKRREALAYVETERRSRSRRGELAAAAAGAGVAAAVVEAAAPVRRWRERLWASQRAGQGKQGAWWMPRRSWPMKDVARRRNAPGSCPASGSGDVRMGQPVAGDTAAPQPEHIGLTEGTGGTETS
jgi:hypothetical protein